MMRILHDRRKGNADLICIFSHFDPNGAVEDYVIHYLQELKSIGFETIFISTSPHLENNSIRQLEKITGSIIVRQNAGYDFGSYKVGIDYIKNDLQHTSRLLLTNDSVFGPFSSIQKAIDDSADDEILGMTDSFDHHYHLQSYFLLYGKEIIKDPEFMKFWGGVKILDADTPDFKKKIILDYEVGGSVHFQKNGMKLRAQFPVEETLTTIFQRYLEKLRETKHQPLSVIRPLLVNFNSTHVYWKELIEAGFPFIKRELLLKNPTNADITTWPTVLRQAAFDPAKVMQALKNFSGNDDFFFTSSPSTIAELMDADGVLTLPINPAFLPWQKAFGIEPSRRFRFDESDYQDLYPDVKVAVAQGRIVSGQFHYRSYGFSEGRAATLKAIKAP